VTLLILFAPVVLVLIAMIAVHLTGLTVRSFILMFSLVLRVGTMVVPSPYQNRSMI